MLENVRRNLQSIYLASAACAEIEEAQVWGRKTAPVMLRAELDSRRLIAINPFERC